MLSTFDEPTRVAIQAEPGRVRQRARRPRAGAQRGARPPARRARAAAAGDAQPRRPETGLARFITALARDRRRGRAGRRDPGASCSSPSTPPSPRSPSVARPFIQETISEAPPTSTPATRTLPLIRPFLAHSATLFADLAARACEALRRDRADDRRGARGRHAGRSRDSRRSTRSSPPTVAGAARFNDDAAARAGIDAARRRRPTSSARRSGSSPRRRPSATTRRCSLRNLASVGRATAPTAAPGSGSSSSTSRRARTARAARRSAPANGGGTDTEQLPALQPVSEHRRARARPRECEAGNEPYLAGQQVIGNAARQPGHNDRGPARHASDETAKSGP